MNMARQMAGAAIRDYLACWRACFAGGDWFERLLARLTPLMLHAAIALALVLIVAAVAA